MRKVTFIVPVGDLSPGEAEKLVKQFKEEITKKIDFDYQAGVVEYTYDPSRKGDVFIPTNDKIVFPKIWGHDLEPASAGVNRKEHCKCDECTTIRKRRDSIFGTKKWWSC